MRALRTVAEARLHLAALPHTRTIGLVPTMGALHGGHVALFRAARRRCDHVIASLFVNPGQFNDPADLAAYPRQESRDLDMAAAASVDAVLIPAVDEIYPPGDATALVVEGAAAGYEGAFRPGHFSSVATVCLKLFGIVRPHVAFFGQKDAQQLAVVRQMVRDLHLDIRINAVSTVREPDGLALSSRNVRLSAAERVRALAIPQALQAGLVAYRAGRDAAATARDELRGLEVDYVEVALFDGQPTLVIAARVGKTRLIDNVPLDNPQLAGL